MEDFASWNNVLQGNVWLWTAGHETGGREQGATYSCVFAKATDITAGLRIHVSLKGFEKVTGEALLQPTYWTCMDTATNIHWEVGTFLSSFAGGCMLGIKEKMTNIPVITTCFIKNSGVREKSLRPNQSESDFLNASDLANIPKEERHTYIPSTLFLRCKANYWMTWVILHLPLKAPGQHL